VQTALDVVYQDSGGLLVFKKLSIGLLALLLSACGAPRPRHATPQNPVESPSTPNLSVPGRVYRIDESHSELRILVYRAGPLAHLGHNHVIINRSLHGVVDVAAAGESAFSVEVPVGGFVVDDAQARSEEGPDFAAAVPDDAKSGTLRNMLGTALLDADEFPTIVIKSAAAAVPRGAPHAGVQDAAGAGAQGGPGSGDMIVAVAISVAGHESTIEVPLNLQSDSNHLSASGSLELRQTALGLTPYSLLLGALQVQDAMTIKFDIVADSN
jgi:YceI-like domain